MTGRKLTYWMNDDDPKVAWVEMPTTEETGPGEPDLPTTAERLAESLNDLTERQRFVLRLRWGLKTGEVYSYEEIAQMMGVDWTTVRGIEEDAFSMLQWLLGTP